MLNLDIPINSQEFRFLLSNYSSTCFYLYHQFVFIVQVNKARGNFSTSCANDKAYVLTDILYDFSLKNNLLDNFLNSPFLKHAYNCLKLLRKYSIDSSGNYKFPTICRRNVCHHFKLFLEMKI